MVGNAHEIRAARRGPSRRAVLAGGVAAAAITGFPYVSRGFAAQTLNFGRVLVTYGSQTAQLTSVADSDVSVPLPKGFLVKEVSAVGFDGLRKEIPFKQQNDNAIFRVEDSANGIHSYEIDYARGVH